MRVKDYLPTSSYGVCLALNWIPIANHGSGRPIPPVAGLIIFCLTMEDQAFFVCDVHSGQNIRKKWFNISSVTLAIFIDRDI